MYLSILFAASLTLPVYEVTERPDRETKVFPGVVKSIDRVDIVPQVCGEILEIGFQDGEIVKKGDMLYKLDNVRYVAEVKNAEAAVAKCEAELVYAKRSYDRHRNRVRARALHAHRARPRSGQGRIRKKAIPIIA